MFAAIYNTVIFLWDIHFSLQDWSLQAWSEICIQEYVQSSQDLLERHIDLLNQTAK